MNTCWFPDCDNPAVKRGFCHKDYEWLRRRGLHLTVTAVCRCGRMLAPRGSGSRQRTVFVDRGAGRCNACFRPAPKVEREPVWRPKRWSRDELLDEWVFLRGHVPFEQFAQRLGIKHESWERTFYRAKVAGDPRAVRARNDPATWPDPAAGLYHVLDKRKRDRVRESAA